MILRLSLTLGTAILATIWTVSIFTDLRHWWWVSDERPGTIREMTIRHGCVSVDSYEGVDGKQRLHGIEWDRPISIAWTFESYQDGWQMPLWPPLVVLVAVSTFVWKRPIVARMRQRKALCRECGYDRHGLAAEIKCPECGAVPTK